VLGRIPEITVEELKEKRAGEDPPVLVDVREPLEYAISDLSDSIKIPLATLPQSLDRVPRDRDVVVYCRTGGRSGNAVQFLQQKGYGRAKNLAGGINAWAERIDRTLRTY